MANETDKSDPRALTDEEKEILDITAELYNKMCRLPKLHSADNTEAAVHIHAIQNIVLARPTERVYTDGGGNIFTDGITVNPKKLKHDNAGQKRK